MRPLGTNNAASFSKSVDDFFSNTIFLKNKVNCILIKLYIILVFEYIYYYRDMNLYPISRELYRVTFNLVLS